MSAPVRFVVPGAIDQRTGGYVYDRRVVEGLREHGHKITVVELAGSFPFVDAVATAAAARCLDDHADGERLVIDGLALPAFEPHQGRLPERWVALVHHPLALETGVSTRQAAELSALERRMLAGAARVVVTSPRTAADVAALGVGVERVGVVLPGTDPAAPATGSSGETVQLLCVASLTPRKGHLVLIEALATLADLDWHLTCIGSRERDPRATAAIDAAIARHGLVERVTMLGELDQRALAPQYDAADLFVLASHHEGYGMVLAEAVAHGLPIVATSAGAIPDTVPRGGGLLAPPNDPEALAIALRTAIAAPKERQRLAAGAAAARAALPSWTDATRAFAAELDRAFA